jgi:hypothetical protein
MLQGCKCVSAAVKLNKAFSEDAVSLKDRSMDRSSMKG